MAALLNEIYEEEFQGFSYGFRPGRSPHHALDALSVGIERKKVNWVLDADISAFFTSLDHGWLEKFLEPFVACLQEAEQKEHARSYVTGLLSDLKRKNVESVAYMHDQDRLPLQKFRNCHQKQRHSAQSKLKQPSSSPT